jgi:hypothetical protein
VSAIRTCLSLALIIAPTGTLQAASPPLVEVEVGKEKLQGRVAVHNDQLFWLMGQDGRLHGLTNDKVKKFRQVSPRFSSYSATVLRDQLRRELGKSFDVVGTRHYTVCAVGDSKARTYAETFEELFRSFQAYFSVRGFKVNEPEFPLIAIIFPDYESFARYAAAESVSVSKNLKGYYLSTSNRVALFEDPASAAAQQSRLDSPRDLPVRSVLESAASFPFGLPLNDGEDSRAWGAIEGSLKDTMIHEATHQVAFNTGLHSRIGASPKWVVEGLATVFEAPGIRNSSSNSGVKTRINRQRFIWFGNYREFRRKPKTLESVISSDDFFKSDVLDAYSEAWAFSFFLIETRPRAYADYLRAIAAHDPLEAYPPQARLADFKRTVSKEIPLLEAEYLRFMAGIK